MGILDAYAYRAGENSARARAEEIKRQRDAQIAALLGHAIEQGTGAIVQGIGQHEQRQQEQSRFDAQMAQKQQQLDLEGAEQGRKLEMQALEAAEPAVPMTMTEAPKPTMREEAKAKLPEVRRSQWASGYDTEPFNEREQQIADLQGVVDSKDPIVDEQEAPKTRDLTAQERGDAFLKTAPKRKYVTDEEVRGVGARRVLTAAEKRAEEQAALTKGLALKEARPDSQEQVDAARAGLIGAQTVTEGEKPENVKADTRLKDALAERARAQAAKFRASLEARSIADAEFGLKPGAKVPEDLRKKIENASAGLAELDHIQKTYDELKAAYGGDVTGPFNAFAKKLKGYPGWNDKRIESFFSEVEMFKTITGHEYFGAALSKHELEQLLASIPNPKDNDKAFDAKVKMQRDYAQRQIKSRIMSPVNAGYFNNPEKFGEKTVDTATSQPVQATQVPQVEQRTQQMQARARQLRQQFAGNKVLANAYVTIEYNDLFDPAEVAQAQQIIMQAAGK